jgi:thiazolylpeptide-type bacteriocin precursor
MESVNNRTAVATESLAGAYEIDGLRDELLQLDIETFEIEELTDLEQHAAKSCTSTCSTCSTTSCCAQAAV